jgi:hypothetical protein
MNSEASSKKRLANDIDIHEGGKLAKLEIENKMDNDTENVCFYIILGQTLIFTHA